MKKLLVQLDGDPLPSVFDRVVAYDAGADDVLAYGGVTDAEVVPLVHGAIFTRGPKDLKNTAIFVGGSNLSRAAGVLDAVRKTFFGPMRVSLMFDPNGSNTTAAAAVVKLVGAVGGDMRGCRALVLAGTGPVGTRVAGLLLRLGAEVKITSRDAKRAAAAAEEIEAHFKGRVETVTFKDPEKTRPLLEWAQVVMAAGPAGVQLVPKRLWADLSHLRAVADVNAVPPLGIEGVEVMDDGVAREGVSAFGALGIGGLKMKTHRAAIARLFESNDLVLDAEEIYDLAAGL